MRAAEWILPNTDSKLTLDEAGVQQYHLLGFRRKSLQPWWFFEFALLIIESSTCVLYCKGQTPSPPSLSSLFHIHLKADDKHTLHSSKAAELWADELLLLAQLLTPSRCDSGGICTLELECGRSTKRMSPAGVVEADEPQDTASSFQHSFLRSQEPAAHRMKMSTQEIDMDCRDMQCPIIGLPWWSRVR